MRAHTAAVTVVYTREFLDFILSNILPDGAHSAGPYDDDDDWSECLTDCGVHDELRATIMHAAMRANRRTKFCVDLVKAFVSLVFTSLICIQEASYQRAYAYKNVESLPVSDLAKAAAMDLVE